MVRISALIHYMRGNFYLFMKQLSTWECGTGEVPPVQLVVLTKEPLPSRENSGTSDVLIASVCILHEHQDPNVNIINTWLTLPLCPICFSNS